MGRVRIKKQSAGSNPPADYIDIFTDDSSGRLSTLDENGVEIQYTNINDEAKVKSDSTDPSPDFLDGKVDDVTLKVNSTTHKMYAVGSTPANTVNVESGESIKDAIDGITDASDSKPYTVLIYPGIYTENNPIQGKSNITVKAVGGNNTVEIIASNANQNMFDGVSEFWLENLTIKGVSGAGKYGFELNSAGGCLLDSVIFRDCSNGVHLNNALGSIIARNMTIIGTTTNGIMVSSGNFANSSLSVSSISTVDTIVNITGANSIATLNTIISFSPNVSTGILVQDQARVVINTSSIVTATDALVLEGGCDCRAIGLNIFNSSNDGVRINDIGNDTVFACNGCVIESSTRYDLNFLSATCLITGIGMTSIDHINFVAGARIYGSMVDTKEDDEGVNILGELHVGLPEGGAESVFGQGDSYTRGMLTYTESAVGDFIDVSSEARSASASTFTFAGVTADNAIYISSFLDDGSDFLKHFGIKTKVETSVVLGGGEIVLEYWNGSTWVEFNGMEVDSGGSYFPHAKNYFQDTGSFQIRYDKLLSVDNWVKNDPMSIGTSYFWARARIKTTITTAPVFQQFKLHTSRFEINNDGWMEYFGKARPVGRLPWDITILEKAATAPKDRDLYLASNIDVGGKKNGFDNNVVSRIGFKTVLPLDCDTSSKIVFSWAIITEGTSGGDIDWNIRWGSCKDGDGVYLSAPGTQPDDFRFYSESLAAPVLAETLQWHTVELDISNMVSNREGGFPDTIWLSIERDGITDTHTDHIALVVLSANYIKWCEGGHVA